MHIFFTDETNSQPTADAKFFIYGGVLFPIDRLVELDRGIETIRLEAGYKPSDELKFDTRARPPHVSVEQVNIAKQKIVELCMQVDCKLIVHIILHDIVKNQGAEERLASAASYVFGRFNHYLQQVGDHGIVMVDNLPIKSPLKYLADKFSTGLTLPDKTNVRLDRIKLFASTGMNASHASSAIDVVLGCFRYCVNNPKNVMVARGMMAKLVKLLWHYYDEKNDTYNIGSRGLITRPPYEGIRVKAYKDEYERLYQLMNDLLAEEKDTNSDTA